MAYEIISSINPDLGWALLMITAKEVPGRKKAVSRATYEVLVLHLDGIK